MRAADLDPAETPFLAKRPASAKMIDGEAHMTATVKGITEPAQGSCFVFGVSGL